MNKIIKKALKELQDAIDNVEGRYPTGDDWQTDDLSLIVSLEAAKRELEAAKQDMMSKKYYAIIGNGQKVWYGQSTEAGARAMAKKIAEEQREIVLVAEVLEEIYGEKFWSDDTASLEAAQGILLGAEQGTNSWTVSE